MSAHGNGGPVTEAAAKSAAAKRTDLPTIMTDRVIDCLEAEAALLGCLLQAGANVTGEILGQVEEADFTSPQHRAVLIAVRALHDAGSPVDPVTTLGQLRRSGLERAMTADRGAGVLLADLYAAPPSVGTVGAYLRILVEHAWRRRVDAAGHRLLQAAGTSSLEVLRDLVATELQATSALAARWAAPAPAMRVVGGAA